MTRRRSEIAAHRAAWSGPAGRERRVAWYRRHGSGCRICGHAWPNELHHLTYMHRTGYEPDADLVALCPRHHRLIHTRHRRLGGALWRVTRRNIYWRRLWYRHILIRHVPACPWETT